MREITVSQQFILSEFVIECQVEVSHAYLLKLRLSI